MSADDNTPATGEDTPTTGHEWDGIKEFDNPLPRWWLWIFYASIAVSVVYWVVMPAWPGINGYTQGLRNHSDRVNLTGELAALDTARGAETDLLATASLERIEADPELQSLALAIGGSVFGDNCATCHGPGGTGSPGYPNLRDDEWLWGGSLQDIHHTINVGVRQVTADRISDMPNFGRDRLLAAEQIADLTEFVVNLSGREANGAAVARAEPIFQQQCASCHRPDGTGDQTKGAPNLTDQVWLYGPSRDQIRTQIELGRGGVMPAWGPRFDPEVIKALAVYIHINSGGE